MYLYLLLLIWTTTAADELVEDGLVQCSTCSSCSVRPEVASCFVSPQPPEDPPPGSDLNWKNTRPFGLRTFYLLKTAEDPAHLTIASTIRWRLPPPSSPVSTPIKGFMVTVTELDSTHTTPLQYFAKLNKPISTLTKATSDVEFYIDSESMFEFGKKYLIEVALVPRGLGGISTHIRQMPPEVPKSCQAEPSDLAKFWAPQYLSIVILEAIAAVNISFAEAPAGLCIPQYSLRVINRDGITQQSAVVNSTNTGIGFYQFKNLPRDVELMIKIVATSSINNLCVCTGCSCITSKSENFRLHSLAPKKIPALPQPELTSPMNQNGGLVFFILLIVVIVALVVFALLSLLYVLHQKNRLLQRTINIMQSTSPLLPTKDYVKGNRILYVAPETDGAEKAVILQLAQLLAQSHHELIYDKFDTLEVEVNVARWIRNSISKADKILVIHSKTPIESMNHSIYNTLCDVLSPQDPRVIHSLLNVSAMPVKPCISETLYVLSRDITMFCAALQIPYDTRWEKLQRDCSLIESCSHEAQRSSPIPTPPIISDYLQDQPCEFEPHSFHSNHFVREIELSREHEMPQLQEVAAVSAALTSGSVTMDSGVSGMSLASMEEPHRKLKILGHSDVSQDSGIQQT